MKSTRRSMWRWFRRNNSQPGDILAYYDITEYPVLVFDLATDLDVRVVGGVPLRNNWTSAIESHLDPPKIWLSPGLSAEVRRGQVAYQLAILLIPQYTLSMWGTPPHETDAAEYASQLLIPRLMVQSARLYYGPDADILADKFVVSEGMMLHRLVKLGIA